MAGVFMKQAGSKVQTRFSSRPSAHARKTKKAAHAEKKADPNAQYQVRGLKESKTLLPLTAVCSLLVAAIMAFGNPVLWTTAEQEISKRFATGTDRQDYQFITDIAGNEDKLSELVCLGEYKAISQDGKEVRAANMDIAARALDGVEIKPNETVSFNKLVGEVSAVKGYVAAEEVVDGTNREEIGGGVGQVATALYIAALKANFDIVERHPNVVVCDYAPIGLDACVSSGQSDLRIKNTSSHSVHIRAVALGQTVEVKLYGTASVSEQNTSTDVESLITERLSKSASEVFENPAAMGYKLDDPITFYVAESYRTTYSDGVKKSSELLSTDTYRITSQSSAMVGAEE